MIYKHKELKKIDFYRIIFAALLIVSFTGLCTGCLFAVKNTYNFDFVKRITLTGNYAEMENKGVFQPYCTILLRDIIVCCIILFLKYSGIQKGLVICMPFIMAVQNGSVYTVLLSEGEISVFQLLFNYVFKDTAVLLIIILYVYTAIKQILNNKSNVKNDIKLLLFYVSTIIFIYLIYFVIKYFIYSGI